MMEQLKNIFKKEFMLIIAAIFAAISLIITPPSVALLGKIDWKTLATLFMLLSVLDGFKTENLFLPLIRLTGHFRINAALSFFLVFCVFFSSMFVTNDVSLIIFVPLTIMLFRMRDMNRYLLPILAMENTAAIRGSLLTPFGSPQNLFLFSQSGIDALSFIKMMLPLWLMSIVLIAIFILFIHRKDLKHRVSRSNEARLEQWDPARAPKRVLYWLLFLVVIICIVTRTAYWPFVTLFVALALLIFDPSVFRRVDYALLGTFFCFFVFSSSLAGNEHIAKFLSEHVSGHEYLWSIGISQIISNVPGAIVLWPFTTNLKSLIYGLDTAGLVFVIGSLASVINLRLYTNEYPGKGLDFLKIFEIYSLAFFIIVFPLQLLLL